MPKTVCPLCGDEFTEADVVEYEKYEKEERFRNLFESQEEVKKLRRSGNLSLLVFFFGGSAGGLMLLGLYGYIASLVWFVLGGILTGIKGSSLDKKTRTLYDQFKSERWATFENGN